MCGVVAFCSICCDAAAVLAQQRQALILDEVNRVGAVRVNALARSLQVSDMTVRRDLDALAEAGLLIKVHGGATSVRPTSTVEPEFAAKATREPAAKVAIAAAAARLIEPGSAVAVSGGTTTHALARAIAHIPGLTVVTNSLPLADLLHEEGAEDQTIVLTGGLRTPTDALVGPLAVDSLTRLHVDLVIMGAHGVDLHAGLTSPNLLEADTNRALAACGRRLVVLADHTKWGIVGLSAFASLDQADVLITDEGMPVDAKEKLQSVVGELVVATVAGSDVG